MFKYKAEAAYQEVRFTPFLSPWLHYPEFPLQHTARPDLGDAHDFLFMPK